MSEDHTPSSLANAAKGYEPARADTGEGWEAYKDVHGHDYWHVKEDNLGIGIALVHAYPDGSPLESSVEERARLIAAAPTLLKAAQLLEAAETFNANCAECDGEITPELCENCFPLFDDARIKRRAAIATATQS